MLLGLAQQGPDMIRGYLMFINPLGSPALIKCHRLSVFR